MYMRANGWVLQHLGKFKFLNAYLREEERSKISVLKFHLKKVGNEKQSKMKIHTRKEIRAEVGENGKHTHTHNSLES